MKTNPIVLYAEDDENDAFFMERAFAKLQRREALRVVPTGKKAVDYLLGTGEFANRTAFPSPQIVVLDVKMPEMSGLEVLAWARGQRTFDPVVIVMFTSSTQEQDVEFSRQHGANAYLVKPSNSDGLFRVIETMLAASTNPEAPRARLSVEGNQI